MSFRPLVLLVLLASAPAGADEAAWRALAEPGTAALMRHATAPGIGDPDHFRLDDCATQRNLDETGRAEARAIGATIVARGIRVDRILTSRWCRARDTARELGVAPVEEFPALDSFFSDRSVAAERGAAVRRLLAERAASEKLILVTHQVNISALTGAGAGSGEILVVAVTPSGIELRGRIAPDELR
jgi:phosphohistidine phosphatase SixA